MKFAFPKVYLAASYNRKKEIAGYRDTLQALGITVTGTWMDEPHSPTTLATEVKETLLISYAQRDLDEIDAADAVISFTEPPADKTWDGMFASETNPRGGRHVEFGYALAKGKELWVVGYTENIFHYLPQVKYFASWKEIMAEAERRIMYAV